MTVVFLHYRYYRDNSENKTDGKISQLTVFENPHFSFKRKKVAVLNLFCKFKFNLSCRHFMEI